jgi:hypothetical protein
MYLGTRTKQHKMRALPTLRGNAVDGKFGRSNEKPHLTVLDFNGHRCQDCIQLIFKTILLEYLYRNIKDDSKIKARFPTSTSGQRKDLRPHVAPDPPHHGARKP